MRPSSARLSRALPTALPRALALAVAMTLAAPLSWALDASQATLVSGTASVATVGSTTTVTQTSSAIRLNWSDLNVPKGSTLAFAQSSATDVALNVVTGSASTAILGSLTAPGRVYVLNPNGILIGQGAQVQVGSLVASALGLASFDSVSGELVLARSGSAAASVVNEGSVTLPNGGTVALVGTSVSNAGTINAPQGRVLMLAGDRVVLTPESNGLLSYSVDASALAASVVNSGTVSSASGLVVLDARSLQQAVVNTTGVIEAGDISESGDGSIRLVALGAAGSEVVAHGVLHAGLSGEISADLTEGGHLDYQAQIDPFSPPCAECALGVSALDKVYDGTTLATLRFDLRSVASVGLGMIDVVMAQFEDSHVSLDGAMPVYLSLAAFEAAPFLGPVPVAVPEVLFAAITPRALHVVGDTKVYDGLTTATAHIQDGDILAVDSAPDALTVSLSGVAYAQAEIDPRGRNVLNFSVDAVTGAAALDYFVASEAFGLITPVVAPTPTPTPTPPTVTIPQDTIDTVSKGGTPTNFGTNPAGLNDLLSRLAAPAAGEEDDETDPVSTLRQVGDNPVRVTEGGVRTPATLR
jgi:filamentous hemagglutinin family protein